MLMPTPPDAAKSVPPERETITADICIIGGGPGGVALAISAAAYGLTVVLIEKHKMGGTSLNYGSIPGVALQASAARANAIRTARPFGITPLEPAVDTSALASQISAIVDQCSATVAVDRLAGLGVRVIQAAARFIDPRTVVAGEQRIGAHRFVIATGSAPVLADIAGLGSVAFETTETIFSVRDSIDHLIVVGGGAAGCELASAHRRLGARVTLIEQGSTLARFDPELAGVVKSSLAADGVVILEETRAVAVESSAGRVRVSLQTADGTTSRVEGSHLLIACGRRAVVDGIGLDVAKVSLANGAVKVDRWLRTSNRRVYAIGDVTGLPHSTHRAEYHASLLAKTLVHRKRAAVDGSKVPVAVHTDPELASVGLTEAEARKLHSAIAVFRWPLRETPRAIATRAAPGHIKIVTTTRGRILGAGIVAPMASELIGVWSLAVAKGFLLDEMAGWIAPYPAFADVSGKVAGDVTGAVRAPVRRGLGKLLARFG